MKSFHLSSISLAATACFAFTSSSLAVEIFSATPENTTPVFNLVGGAATPGMGTLTGTVNNLTLTNTTTNFGAYGFASSDDIGTLVGPSVSTLETVTFSVTVDSITGDIRANGFEFGMADTASFRGGGTSNLIMGIQDANGGGDAVLIASFQDDGDSGTTVTEDSLRDGFTATLTVNSDGYTFFVDDVITGTAATNFTLTGTFAGSEFLDNFTTGHFYTTVQRFNTTDVVMEISSASMDATTFPDMDGDGIPDSFEDVTPGLDRDFAGDASQGANDGLFDNDGRTNLEEFLSGTDPNIADVDLDNLNDGEEFAEGTNPLIADTDGDLLNDGAEVNGDLNPFQVGHVAGNTPGGIPGERTNPLVADTDGDNISDFEELDGSNGSITNPNTNDTDGDTLFDDEEVNSGLDPNDPNGDNGADADPDGDTLSNLDEVIAGTNPLVADSDGDMLDDDEELNGDLNPFQADHIPGDTPAGIPGEPTDPLLADSDGDGLSDGLEVDASNGSVTNPNSPDTDGDGFNDLIEIEAGSLPNDSTSIPVFPLISWSAQELDEESDLSTNGTLLFADNFQGTDVTVNGIPFIGQLATNGGAIDFSSPNLQTQLRRTSTGLSAALISDIYDDEVPALTPLLDTFWFQGGGTEVVNYSITGLTPGMSYLVEIGRSDDRGGDIINRYVRADDFGGGVETDPIGATNLTYGGPDNPAILVSGTFTAAHTVQAFRWEQFLADDTLEGSNIQFIQVREIELPSDIQVCDIRPTSSTVEVDFAGLDLTRSYQLVRSTDLQDGFPTIVDGPRAPAAAADTFIDPSPLAISAFYRLEEMP